MHPLVRWVFFSAATGGMGGEDLFHVVHPAAARVCDVVEVAIIHPYDYLARFGDYKYESRFFETILLYFWLSTFGKLG
jgi:hypothetical protein